MWRARAVFTARLALLAATFSVVPKAAHAQAAPSPNDLEQAADAFDAGVDAFERAEYSRAVYRFLGADALVPNTDALNNAFAAAERAQNDALVATVAVRIVAREALAPTLAARARKALADTRSRISELVVSCTPEPCELVLDGEPIPHGTSYALPGKHRLSANGPNDERAERSIEAVAGERYVVALAFEPVPDPGVSVSSTTPNPPQLTSPPRPEGHTEPPLAPTVFYTGVGVTVVLAAATTWSGIDTLRAENRLPGTESDNADVRARAHRTDALLIGTVLAGAATAYVGLVLTDWGPPGSRTGFAVSLYDGGAVMSLTGTR